MIAQDGVRDAYFSVVIRPSRKEVAIHRRNVSDAVSCLLAVATGPQGSTAPITHVGVNVRIAVSLTSPLMFSGALIRAETSPARGKRSPADYACDF